MRSCRHFKHMCVSLKYKRRRTLVKMTVINLAKSARHELRITEPDCWLTTRHNFKFQYFSQSNTEVIILKVCFMLISREPKSFIIDNRKILIRKNIIKDFVCILWTRVCSMSLSIKLYVLNYESTFIYIYSYQVILLQM